MQFYCYGEQCFASQGHRCFNFLFHIQCLFRILSMTQKVYYLNLYVAFDYLLNDGVCIDLVQSVSVITMVCLANTMILWALEFAPVASTILKDSIVKNAEQCFIGIQLCHWIIQILVLVSRRAQKKSHPVFWDKQIFFLGKEHLKLTGAIGKGTSKSSSN